VHCPLWFPITKIAATLGVLPESLDQVPSLGPGVLENLMRASGAVGVFLLGMVLMTEGLKQLAGSTLRDILGRCVDKPLRGMVTGAGVTVAMQASSSTVLATVGFATAGIISLQQAIAVVAGATVGTTSTSWLMATVGLKASVSMFAAPLVLIGALLRMLRRGREAQIGLLIAGFGMLVLGIASLKDAIGPVVAQVRLDQLDASTLGGTLWLVLIGGLLAIVMQSSAAPVALAMAALADDSLTFQQAAPLVVGASVGTTSTALLALPGVSPPGRRVAIVWIIVSLIAATLALLLLPFLEAQSMGLTRFFSATDPIALAVFHTSFATLGAIASILVAAPLARKLEKAIPDRGPGLTEHLDSTIGGVPAIALEAARRSIASTAAEAVRAAVAQLSHGEHAGSERIALIKRAEEAIDRFLAGVRRDALGSRDAERVVACLQALDHVRELRRMLKRHELRPPMGEPQASRAIRDRAVQVSSSLLAWLDQDGPSPLEDVERFAAEVGAARPAIRSASLQSTARGTVAPEIADAALDAIRAMDEYARELHRIVANLDLSRDAIAPVSNE